MVIIDAKNMIIGRIASIIAKRALLGEKISIINCEDAIITGNKDQIFARFKQKRDMGIPLKGPYIHRSPDKIVRRIVRGMLPYKKPRGRDAYKRVMCYVGFPSSLKESKDSVEKIDLADISKFQTLKYISIGEVSKFLGSKKYKAQETN